MYNKHLLPIVITAILIGGLVVVLWNKKDVITAPAVSPNILYITNPVTNFSGVVEKIDGDTLTLTQLVPTDDTNTSPLPSPVKSGTSVIPRPTPIVKKITYKVTVKKETTIQQSQTTNPFDPVNTTSGVVDKTVTLRDLRVGQYITAISTTDLRKVTDNTFTAASISLAPIQNILSGMVVKATGTQIVVNSVLPVFAGAKIGSEQTTPKDYSITINAATVLYRQGTSTDPTKTVLPTKISLSEIKAGDHVTIYTNEDLSMAEPWTAKAVMQQPLPKVSVPAIPVLPTSAPLSTPTTAISTPAAQP